MADLEQDLKEALVAGDPVVWRTSKEAIRRLYNIASEAEKLRLEFAGAEESLREAGTTLSSPIAAGVAQLVDERNGLRAELTAREAAIALAGEVIDLAKGALVAQTTPDHPWYRPGEPDGQPGYHCPRCKALNEIEMWRRNHV